MNNHARIAFALAAAFAAPVPALADDAPVILLENRHFAAADDARLQADAWKRWAEDFSRDLRTNLGTTFGARLGGKVVKGAPYSAEVITESNQMLADGNAITRKTQGAVYRDGEGRLRQETGGDGKAPTVYINDPVAGKHYVVSPGAKHAVAMPLPKLVVNGTGKHKQVVRVGGTEIRIEDGKTFVDGQEASGRIEKTSPTGKRVVVENGRITIDGKELTPHGIAGSHDPGQKVTVEKVYRSDADGAKREEVQVRVVNMGEHPMPPAPPAPPTPGLAPLPPTPPLPPMPGIQTMRFESTAKLGKGITTSLGMKDFDGVKAEGKATTWTIPAGEIGNRNAILIASETWYSPDLQATVYSRYNDPRTGETVYRLANIRRGEPAAELFAPPEDAKVRSRR